MNQQALNRPVDVLLPCPFCGGKAKAIKETIHFPNARNGWYAACDTENCPAVNIAEDGEMGGVIYAWKTRKEAIAAWNHRAPAAGSQS